MVKKKVKKAAKKAGAVRKQNAKKTAPKKATAKQTSAVKEKNTSVSPYLTFDGNCEEAFNHYKSVFGGKFKYVGRFKEMPPMEGMASKPFDGEKIMHITLPIGPVTILMGSDLPRSSGFVQQEGNNFQISVNAKSKAEADKLFNGLSSGGNTIMPMANTFWGSYFGMCTDKFNIKWMVSFDKND